MAKLTVAKLWEMKKERRRIVASVCYDYQMAQILDRAGADLISVGDSIGRSYWGQATPYEVTMDQMVLTCLAVTRGVQHAVVNCDLPFGPVQAGPEHAVAAAIRLVKEGHAEMIKIDDSANNLDTVRAIVRTGIPLWCQFGFSPTTSMAIGGDFTARTDEMLAEKRDQIIREAQELEAAGAAMLDLTNVNTEIYTEVQRTVSIPVLGGQTGPEADGRIMVITHRANQVDRTDLPINIGRYIYESVSKAFDNIRSGNF